MLKQWQDPTLAEGFSTIVKISTHNPTSSGSARVAPPKQNQRVTRVPPRKQPVANAWRKPIISTAARNQIQQRPTGAPPRKQHVNNAWKKPTTSANAWQKAGTQDRPLRTHQNIQQHRQQRSQQQYQQQPYQRRPSPPQFNPTDVPPMPQRESRQSRANPSPSESPWGGFAGPRPTPTQAWKWPRQTYMQSPRESDASPAAQTGQPEPAPAIPLPNMLRVSVNAVNHKHLSRTHSPSHSLPLALTASFATRHCPIYCLWRTHVIIR